MTLTQCNSSVLQHHRRLSTVHLAGLSVLTYVHEALHESQHQHNSNVLMHALLTPDVSLPSGVKNGNVGYITGFINI